MTGKLYGYTMPVRYGRTVDITRMFLFLEITVAIRYGTVFPLIRNRLYDNSKACTKQMNLFSLCNSL